MYFETVFCFYILLNHFIGYSFLWLDASPLLAILSSGIMPHPRQTQLLHWIHYQVFCRKALQPSLYAWAEPEYYMAKVIVQNYPHLLPESIALFQFTPLDNFTPFPEAIPSIHFGKTIDYFVSPLSMSWATWEPLDFPPGKDQFHNFFGILLTPKPITDVVVMAAKLLIFRLALKFISTKIHSCL